MVGLDPDWRSLREHRLALPRVTAVSDGLPFATASFDLIFASWVLEHLADPAPTFAEMGRVLKPGGAFVFITPNGRHPLTLLNRGLGRFSRIQGYVVERFYGRAPTDTFPTFYRANSATTIQKLCQQNKLVLETLHAISDPTYLAFNQSLFRLMCQIEDKLPASRKLHLVGLARKK
jgi:SAM-dependent methyltransferase